VSLRAVIVTRILPVALGFGAVLRGAGHEPVGLLTIRDTENRYGSEFTLEGLLGGLPPEYDVVLPSRRSQVAPLLASLRPDIVVCMGFPWKIPADALAVPPLGWLNGHPSLLPRHRGPVPIAWAIRNGDAEVGVTFHRMDAELDTGPILAQAPFPLGEYVVPNEFYERMGPLVMETLATALERLAAGEEGTAQGDGGEYESFLSDDDAWLDPARPALELHRLVWAWRYTIPRGELRGALVDLGGETVRVLASSLTEVEDAQRLDCADAPLWLVDVEPAQAGAAAAAGAESSS
jgi:methionyl-tRNA formyltransferase